MDAESTP